MIRRVFVVFALLSALTAFGSAPTLAHSEGACSNDAWGGTSATAQFRFDRYQSGSDYYDELDGWVTYRALYPCTGSGTGFSFNAAVNAEDNVAGKIWQIGIWRLPGGTAHFVYAAGTANAVQISSPTPTLGQRYNFRIWRSVANNVRLAIYNSSGTRIWVLTSTAWSTNMKHGWWGWETENSEDMPGFQNADPNADLVGQISRSGDGVPPFDVTGIGPDVTFACPINSCSFYWPSTVYTVTGQSNQIFNVKTP